MITGKHISRQPLAKHALESFTRQTYRTKHMIIINHGSYNVIETPKSNISEIHVHKDTSLGDMRNRSLSLIPFGSVFAVFDDDDYRPDDYLQILKEKMDKHEASLVCLSTRLECNVNTEFVWKTYLRRGLPSTIIARRVKGIVYKSLRTMEDTAFISDYKASGKNVVVLDNDPKLYIRTIHGDNTSLFADKYKIKVYHEIPLESDFREDEVSREDGVWVHEMLERYVL